MVNIADLVKSITAHNLAISQQIALKFFKLTLEIEIDLFFLSAPTLVELIKSKGLNFIIARNSDISQKNELNLYDFLAGRRLSSITYILSQSFIKSVTLCFAASSAVAYRLL